MYWWLCWMGPVQSTYLGTKLNNLFVLLFATVFVLTKTASTYCLHNVLGIANKNFKKDHSAPDNFSTLVNARSPSD